MPLCLHNECLIGYNGDRSPCEPCHTSDTTNGTQKCISWAGGTEPLHISVKCHRVGACILSVAPTALSVTVTELVLDMENHRPMFVFQAAGRKTFFLLKFPIDPHPPGPFRGFSLHSKWRRQIGSAPGEASSTRGLMHYDHRYDFTFNFPQSSWISSRCCVRAYVGFKDKRCLLQPTASLLVAGRPKKPRYLVIQGTCARTGCALSVFSTLVSGDSGSIRSHRCFDVS